VTAAEFADDLQHFLNNEPITARPVLTSERLLKCARRRPAIAALFVAVHLLLIALMGLGVWSYVSIRQALDAAKSEETRARLASEESRQLAQQEAATRAKAERLSTGLTLERAFNLASEGRVGRGLLWMAEALRIAPADAGELRQVAHANFDAWRSRAAVPRSIIQHDSPILMVARDRQGRILATAAADGLVRFWDAATGSPTGSPIRHGKARLRLIALSPDGATLASATDAGSEGTRLWDTATGKSLSPVIPHRKPAAVLFRPDGQVFADAEDDGVAQLRDARTGKPVGKPMPLDGIWLAHAFSPNAQYYLTVGVGSASRLWDGATGEPRSPPLVHESWAHGACFSPDSSRFITTTADHTNDARGTLRIWDTARAQVIASAPTSPHGCTSVAYRPDGRALVTCGYGDAQLWDAETAQPIGPILRHDGWVLGAAFSPDGLILATACGDGAVRLWDGYTAFPEGLLLEHGGRASGVEFRDDGRTLYTASSDGTLRIWDIAPLAPPGRPLPYTRLLHATDLSSDGRLLSTASFDGTARVFDSKTGQPIGPPLLHEGRVRFARFSHNGKAIAVGGDDGTVRLWDLTTFRPMGPALPHGHWVISALFSPDDRRLLVGRVEGIARLWDLSTFQPIGPPLEHPTKIAGSEVWNLDFIEHGHVAVTGCTDGTIGFWDSATGKRLGDFVRVPDGIAQILRANEDTLYVFGGETVRVVDLESRSERRPPFGRHVRCIALSHDGRKVLVGGQDKAARLLDAATGRQLGPAMMHTGPVKAVAFNPIDTLLLTAADDQRGSIRFWDAVTCQPVGPPSFQGGVVRSPRFDDHQGVFFHPTGERAFAGSDHVTIWPVPRTTEESPASLAAQARLYSGIEIQGQTEVPVSDESEWRSIRQEVERTGLALGRIDDAEWHDRMAASCEQHGPPASALWHLDRLVQARPEDWSVLTRRARVRRGLGDNRGASLDEAQAAAIGPPKQVRAWMANEANELAAAAERDGRWADAVTYFDTVAAAAPDSPVVHLSRGEAHARRGHWPEAAADFHAYIDSGPFILRYTKPILTFLRAGDRSGYRLACSKLQDVALSQSEPYFRAMFVNLFTLGPEGFSNAQNLLRLAEGSDGSAPGAPDLLGAALYRAGQHHEAIRRLEEHLNRTGGAGLPQDRAFLAMAHVRQGHLKQARRLLTGLAQVAPSTDPNRFWADLEIEILRREAEELLLDSAFPTHPFAR